IECPVLLLSGESDPFAQVDLLRSSVRLLRRGQLVTFPGVVMACCRWSIPPWTGSPNSLADSDPKLAECVPRRATMMVRVPRPQAMARAMQRAQQLSDERFLADMQAAVDDMQARGASHVACWGVCMGGRLADVSAARVRGLSGAVAYYGHLQAEPGRLSPLQLAAEIRIPLLSVFGGADPNITADQIAAFREKL